MKETEELFDTLEIARLAKYFEVSAGRRIEPLTNTLAKARTAKLKTNKAKPVGVSQAQFKTAARPQPTLAPPAGSSTKPSS